MFLPHHWSQFTVPVYNRGSIATKSCAIYSRQHDGIMCAAAKG